MKEIPREEISKYKLDNGYLEDGVIGDTVNVRKLKIIEPYTDFCKVYDISWSYTGGQIINADSNIKIPPEPESTVITTDVPVHIVAQEFYQRNISLITSGSFPVDQKAAGAYLIAMIALQINNIQRDVFTLFSNDSDFNVYITTQNLEWSLTDIFINPTVDDFQLYLNNITDFYNSIYANQLYIQNAKTETKLYWLAFVLSENALRIVPAYDKITILDLIAKGTIKGETSRFINAVNEENFAIKIVKSIAPGQEDDFLNGLINVKSFDAQKSYTLFQSLYDKVNDVGIGDENLKTLMNDLHKIWLRSSFFPYNVDGTVKDNLINPTIYASKPIYLNYESGTILWVFNTSNYDFSFNSLKIDITETIDQTTEYGGTSYINTVGSYDIYQTITIKNTDSNTNSTKFISVNVDSDQQAALPIFYLKYIDDKKSTDNLVTELELTADLILSLVGIGNLSKLRHVRSIFRLGRVALGLETAAAGDILVTYELAQGVAGAIEVTGSLASIFINYADNYKNTYCNVSSSSYDKAKCDFYTRLDNIFLVMQLFSGALDFATSRQLKKAAQDLLEGPIPDDFHPNTLAILRKFAGDINEIKEIFRLRLVQRFGDDSAIWIKINNTVEDGGLPVLKQEEFIIDFERADGDVLDVLNANDGDLIHYWDLSEDLRNERKIPNFLRVSKRVYSETRIDDHFLILDFKTTISGKIKISGGHQEKSMKAGLLQNYELILEDIQDLGDKYRRAVVKVRLPNGGIIKKTSKSTLVPNDWSVKKIKSEISFALYKAGNPKYVDVSDRIIYDSFFSDGTEVDIILIRDFTGEIRLDNILVQK